MACGDSTWHRACRLPLQDYGDTLGPRDLPDAVKCPWVICEIRVVSIGVRDERLNGLGRSGFQLVVRKRNGGGLMAFNYGDLVLYDVYPMLYVEVVEHRRFWAQSS